jgi:hypothetical protein
MLELLQAPKPLTELEFALQLCAEANIKREAEIDELIGLMDGYTV